METALHNGVPASDAIAVAAQFHALLQGCGLYEPGTRARIAVTGDDRGRWLNGMVTNNVRDLAAGHGVFCFLLNPQGHIQADLYAFQRGDSFLLDMDGAQREKVMQWLDRYIIADDVELSDVSAQFGTAALAGPGSRKVLEEAGFAVPSLAHLQFSETTWGDHKVTLVRSDQAAGESWQVWTMPEEAAALREALAYAGAVLVSVNALELFRISNGVPQLGKDIRDRDLPQETGQSQALNFSKGCYLGQEIVERIRSRGAVHRQFTAFAVEGPLPPPGTKIVALRDNENEKEAGEITSSATLPLPGGDRAVALGYLRREAAAKILQAGTAKLTPVPLPVR